eukprot:255526-Lingulodinium_polyedra.AAC.1
MSRRRRWRLAPALEGGHALVHALFVCAVRRSQDADRRVVRGLRRAGVGSRAPRIAVVRRWARG